MMLTEEEAKTKLCPEAIGPGDMNWAMVPSSRMCIGSTCMAWRWVVSNRADTYGRANRDEGYCGKAGKP